MKTARSKSRLKYSLTMESLTPGGSYLDRFRLAVEAGFEGIEIEADGIADQDEVERIGEAAQASGLTIHSVAAPANWAHPFSSEDPREVSKGVQATLRALENAHYWGADTLLVVPGIVTAAVSYAQVYLRSQHVIRNEILPVAQGLGIVLAIENVWNGFLLSPMEYVRYIDEFESPWVRAYLDVGNMVFGHPEHWIRIAGSRTIKLHVKDYQLNTRLRRFAWNKIGQGAIKWNAINEALAEVGFSGWATNTEPKSLLTRGANFAAKTLHQKLAPRLPSLDLALWKVQRHFARHSLHDAALRCDRFLH